jgi:hypothetical protein
MIRGNKKKGFVRSKKPKTKDKKTKGFSRGNKSDKPKKSFKRKDKAQIMPDKQLGGFLPFPPKDCKKKEFILWCFGIKWIDLNICHGCSNINECVTRKEHLNKLKEQRKEYFAEKERRINAKI